MCNARHARRRLRRRRLIFCVECGLVSRPMPFGRRLRVLLVLAGKRGVLPRHQAELRLDGLPLPDRRGPLLLRRAVLRRGRRARARRRHRSRGDGGRGALRGRRAGVVAHARGRRGVLRGPGDDDGRARAGLRVLPGVPRRNLIFRERGRAGPRGRRLRAEGLRRLPRALRRVGSVLISRRRPRRPRVVAGPRAPRAFRRPPSLPRGRQALQRRDGQAHRRLLRRRARPFDGARRLARRAVRDHHAARPVLVRPLVARQRHDPHYFRHPTVLRPPVDHPGRRLVRGGLLGHRRVRARRDRPDDPAPRDRAPVRPDDERPPATTTSVPHAALDEE
mmetsp:Transcript_7585/g.22369  ORF Transcript_7585/g.22369 Transcript_7585/m.22369 type:complete len:334 (-) Transcript_7585:1084-2085(-)